MPGEVEVRNKPQHLLGMVEIPIPFANWTCAGKPLISCSGSGDFWSDRVDGFIGNHSDCHRFSRYLILDFNPLFWKNTLGLNDCVH